MKALTTILAIVILFILGGCSENSTPISPQDNQASLSKVPVPIKIIVDGISSVNPSTMLITFTATCIGSHIGKSDANGTAILSFMGPNYGNLPDGQFTLIAANGDEIHMTGTGTFLINGLQTEYVLNYTVVGGTGRFEGATGVINGVGIGDQIDPANPFVKSVHIEGHGNIIY